MESNSWSLSVILGIVQGLSEFLPISSSGHLILVSWLMEGKPLPLALNIALHMGTLLAVFIYFWHDWWQLGRAFLKRVVHQEKSFHSDTLLPALIVGSIPAAILGLSAKDTIESWFHHPLVVTLPLFGVGFLLWQVDKRYPADRGLPNLSIKDGLLVGLAQALALIPGVSRSGATITAGRMLRMNRQEAARFSFLLGTPAMVGAGLLHLGDFAASVGDPNFYLAILVSCLVGCLAIKGLLNFIRRFGFLAFAIYRALIAVAIWVLLFQQQA